jgi:hypothetical protein
MKRKEITALNQALKIPDVQVHIKRKEVYWKVSTKDILYRWVVHWVTDRIQRMLLNVPLSRLLQIHEVFNTILVITIKDGVVNEARSFINNVSAEKYYIKTCLNYGAQREHMGIYLEDGYYEWANGSVCLTHPEINW